MNIKLEYRGVARARFREYLDLIEDGYPEEIKQTVINSAERQRVLPPFDSSHYYLAERIGNIH